MMLVGVLVMGATFILAACSLGMLTKAEITNMNPLGIGTKHEIHMT